jgi:hypothetical protein
MDSLWVKPPFLPRCSQDWQSCSSCLCTSADTSAPSRSDAASAHTYTAAAVAAAAVEEELADARLGG